MKYSFMRWCPRENTRWADSRMSASETFLLTTSRMRWVPASGEKVRPDMPKLAISPKRSSPSPYARKDETDNDTLRSRSLPVAAFTKGDTHE